MAFHAIIAFIPSLLPFIDNLKEQAGFCVLWVDGALFTINN